MSKLCLSFIDRILSVHTLNQNQTYSIGSDPDCDIHIDSMATSPRHAIITFNDGTYYIEEIKDSNGIHINNKKIEHPTALADDDYIEIGKHNLVFTYDEKHGGNIANSEPEYESPKPKRTAWVQFLNGKNMGKTMPISKSMTNIGHEQDYAALISHRANGYFISHLKGDMTPIVNNRDIGDNSYRLGGNCNIQIGPIKMLFYMEEK